MGKAELLSLVTKNYLESPGFNGLPLVALDSFDEQELESLIHEEMIEAVSFDDCLNPYIKANDFQVDLVKQINNVKNKKVGTVLYPSKKSLQGTMTNPMEPYLAELLKGEPRNKIIYFDPEIIMLYVNNPRDENGFYGYRGYITHHEECASTNGRDEKIVIDYGVAYKCGDKPERAVGVILYDLSKLSPMKQMLWKNFEKLKQADYVINTDFAHEVNAGKWNKRVWIFDALLTEMETINQLCEVIGLPPMFKETYSAHDHNRPIGYITLLIPTRKYFHDFVVALEKLLVNNLNAETFLATGENIQPVAKLDSEGKERGTLSLLSEWITRNTIPKENVPELIINPLKKIRKIRQKPAHKLDVDEYDVQYTMEQAELIKEAYCAIGAIRYRLSRHPKCRCIYTPESISDPDSIINY